LIPGCTHGSLSSILLHAYAIRSATVELVVVSMCVRRSAIWIRRRGLLQFMIAIAGHFLCVLVVAMGIGFLQAELLLQRQPEIVEDALSSLDALFHAGLPPSSKWYASEAAQEEICGLQRCAARLATLDLELDTCLLKFD